MEYVSKKMTWVFSFADVWIVWRHPNPFSNYKVWTHPAAVSSPACDQLSLGKRVLSSSLSALNAFPPHGGK